MPTFCCSQFDSDKYIMRWSRGIKYNMTDRRRRRRSSRFRRRRAFDFFKLQIGNSQWPWQRLESMILCEKRFSWGGGTKSKTTIVIYRFQNLFRVHARCNGTSRTRAVVLPWAAENRQTGATITDHPFFVLFPTTLAPKIQ